MSIRGRWADAEAALRRAIELSPQNPHYFSYLSTAVLRLGRGAEAERWARQAIAFDSQQASYWSNLGDALAAQGSSETSNAYRQAVAINPRDAGAWQGLASAEHSCGRLDSARQAFEQSLAIAPGGNAAIGYAFLLNELHQQDRAIAVLQEYLRRNSDVAIGWSVLCNVSKSAGDITTMETACRRALPIARQCLGALDSAAHSNLLYLLSFLPRYSSAEIYEEHRTWNRLHAEPLAKFIRPHTNDRSPDRRLRVGYVSPDFRNHCQSFFTTPLLEAHDHDQFEILCYSHVLEADSVTERLRSLADGWRDISRYSDEQAAALIRQDQIDVLVDLTMHMEGCRPLIFARRPAPVQVSWLAYPGTTGLATIDYRLTDPYLDPPGLFDSFYSEESVRLPDSFWCYEPLTAEPAVNALPAAERGYITFGSLNNFCKVNDAVLKLWCDVLRVVDDSRLLMLAGEGSQRNRVQAFFQREGIALERIEFVSFQPRQQYLQTFHRIDIGLDTFPYNGHTTSLDSFWMGVPVITLMGRTVVGRAGISQLTNLGLERLIAQDADEYVRIVSALAGDLAGLNQLRQNLREGMRRSPLMDAPRFARNVESAYRAMWRRWCAGGGR